MLLLTYVVGKDSGMECATMKDHSMDGMVGDRCLEGFQA